MCLVEQSDQNFVVIAKILEADFDVETAAVVVAVVVAEDS